LEYGGDEDLAIAALLHDSVEDQGGMASHLAPIIVIIGSNSD
jgi:(p)ppGpp synthase/HD superfamily hydrolase